MKLRVKIDDQIFDVEVGDLKARPILATVEGETFEVWPEENQPAEVIAEAAEPRPAPCPEPAKPASGEPVDRSKSVSAPIPGVIIAVQVKPGDAVTSGTELITLEAMKMKNAIRATRDGKIAAVRVNVGDHVRHGQVLVEFTD
jgi:biotin carboxyl carrier protein